MKTAKKVCWPRAIPFSILLRGVWGAFVHTGCGQEDEECLVWQSDKTWVPTRIQVPQSPQTLQAAE